MAQHTVGILSINKITHDVLKIVTNKPDNYIFVPGQATEVSINSDHWQEEKRPFTFTCLPGDSYLEFIIKTYPVHQGVTNEMLHLEVGSELILHEIFGTIAYKTEGVFIAGGAGITPFISIFRYLQANSLTGNNKLIFANKTQADIILKEEFQKLLGNNFINILSDEKINGYANGHITEKFITENCDIKNQLFYLCGPPPMMKAVEFQLKNLGVPATSIVKEVF